MKTEISEFKTSGATAAGGGVMEDLKSEMEEFMLEILDCICAKHDLAGLDEVALTPQRRAEVTQLPSCRNTGLPPVAL